MSKKKEEIKFDGSNDYIHIPLNNGEKVHTINLSSLIRLATQLYNIGYNVGHNDTVDSVFTYVNPLDFEEIHKEEAVQIIKEFVSENPDIR